MTINGVNINTYGARQARITVGHHDWKQNTDWTAGSVLPIFGNGTISLKSLSVELNIKGTNREDLIGKRSSLLSLLKGKAEIELDGYTHKFCVVMKSHKEKEVNKKKWHQLTLELEGYEYGASFSAQTTDASTSALSVNNPGNLPSPCCVEITPRAGAQSITLTGLCRDSFTGSDLPVVINSIVIGKVVKIDAMTGLITQDGSIKDMDIWALPSMKPGLNQVTCNNANMTVKVTTTPLYE